MAGRWMIGAAALLGLGAAAAIAQPPAPADPLTVDRVVVVMRHGVRPPTKDPAMPAQYADGTWPSWSVKWGWLTLHGAKAVAAVGGADRQFFLRTGLFGKGCPDAAIIADSDQRTIATAEAYAGTLAPGCTITIDHQPQGVNDPRFSAITKGLSTIDVPAANAALAEAIGPGGIGAVDARMRPLIDRLNAVLCARKPACGIVDEKTVITPSEPQARAHWAGMLDRGSGAAQAFLLEYGDGKPMNEVAWGRATPADIAAFSEFHALEFKFLARPKPIATANMAALIPDILKVMGGGGPKLLMISGHDTNVANMGGILGIHWSVPGFATDDPAPGGAVILERLKDKAGNAYVRAYYRAQTLDQIRAAAAPSYREVLPIAGCNARGIVGLCTIAQFEKVMSGK